VGVRSPAGGYKRGPWKGSRREKALDKSGTSGRQSGLFLKKAF
jgi:hypothetical protein